METTLAYRKNGSGSAVLFLHGFCETKDVWQAFENRLSSKYQTISVDLPGFGESVRNQQYTSIEAMAQAVKVALTDAGEQQCTVIAHSLGGYVALALAELFPDTVNGLCLFHSTAYADSEEKKQNRTKTADFIRRNGIGAFLDNFIPSLFFTGNHNRLAAQIQAYRQLTQQTPVDTAVAVTLAMRERPDRTAVLSRADYPVMFIAGKDDTAVPLATSKEQFFLPKRSSIHLLSETGHMGMYEREAETLEMIEGFLRLVHPASVN